MNKPLITIEDWSGGNTLNEEVARKNQSFRSFGLDLVSRPGSILTRQAYQEVTGATPSNKVVHDAVYCINDANLYFAIDNGICIQISPNVIFSLHGSSNSSPITALREYNGFLYYFQSTTIGRYDLNTLVFNDNWKTGITASSHPNEISSDNFLYVGAGRYLDRIDTGGTYASNVLDLKSGWEVKCLSNFGIPFLAIGANFSGPSSSTKCKVYLWDRISQLPNDEIEIPELTIYAMVSYKGGLWVFAGSTALSIYYVPLGSRSAIKVFSFENSLTVGYFYDSSVAVNAVTIKNGRIYFGYSSNVQASDQSLPAVYSFNPNPNNFQLQGEFFPSDINELGDDDVNISVVKAFPIGPATIYTAMKYGTGTNDTYLIARESSNQTNPFNNSIGLQNVRTITYSAPAGKKMLFDGFGIDFGRLTAGSVKLEYRKNAETTFTEIKTYSTANGISFYKQFKLEAFEVAFKITVTVNGRVTFPVKRFYGTGTLIADDR